MLFFITACSKEHAVIPIPPVFPADTTQPAKTYLALGDSYTIGASVSTQERFPMQTWAKLALEGVKMSQPEIIATTGWTTGNLLSALAMNPPTKTYDVVSLLIGVNNQYQRRSQAEYKTEFTLLLNKAIGFAGGRKNSVFVLSIPDYSVTPFVQNSDTAAISNEIDQFNDINRQVSQELGVKYLDITSISREGRTDPAMQASDGLHPSGKQYQRWSALLAPMIKTSL
ncbi:MAG: SGNH/GDSL hydrolase family protein [Rhizobacter sp.]|nr:SGNH/GDSL hydrolase family protein [Ferruginibacter sp.]